MQVCPKETCIPGHEISGEGVSTNASKIQAIKEWKVPRNVKELRSWLRMVGYYRRYVKDFGIISRCLFDLLKKGAIFVWTQQHEEAFQTLKKALMTAPVLVLSNFQLPFEVETNACEYGVGAVLMQKGHPIAFLSKALGPKNRGLSTYEKECLAILMAMDKWRPYLQRGEFVIKTDQKALTHLDDQRQSTPWQHRAPTKLLGLNYKIIYKKGYENRAADALSRRRHSASEEMLAVSTCTPTWLEEVTEEYLLDEKASKLLAELTISKSVGPFSLAQGIIHFKGRIWLHANSKLKKKVLQALHASAVAGH